MCVCMCVCMCMCVLLEGASRETAFIIGNDIAEEVTKRNTNPVTLKFDKVLFVCICVYLFVCVCAHICVCMYL